MGKKNPQPKRRRFQVNCKQRKTTDQLQTLEKYYQSDIKPNVQETGADLRKRDIREIAATVDLSLTQVYKWFWDRINEDDSHSDE